ncbi:hypothetical protein [Novosphingobium sp.]|uniref:hypothetical protein n=1 Tax=Novosphingobium sp. TaxID=1874826 RepID=UPI002620E615|nr:hypothetical protein [Novosphingobium sp.]
MTVYTENDIFFETFGPFTIPVSDGAIKRPPASWWEDEVENSTWENLSRAIGCYMFVMGDANIKPWYVGKTVNQHGFREEVFASHKLNHYNWVLANGYRGPPQMYLFPMITKPFHQDWRFSRGQSNSGPVKWLESTLMGMAFAQNPDIANSKELRYFRSVHVRGILGRSPSGKRTGYIAKARQALLGEKP